MPKNVTTKGRLPMLRPGLTVRVHLAVKEGDKERLQIAEGLILALHRGRTAADRTMTIRKVVEGIGVERVLPLASPLLTRIDVVKEAKVRRAKLTFIRKAVGRASRMKERFTDVVASPEQPTVVEQPQAGPLKAES